MRLRRLAHLDPLADIVSALTGRVIAVTGAGRGLGRAIAHAAASAGAGVAVIDRDLRSYAEFAGETSAMTADSTVDELRSMGVDARGYSADLSDQEATQQAMADVAADFGRLDGVVANAGGGSGELGGNRAGSLDTSELDTALRRNLFTAVHTCTAALPHLSPGGSFVLMGSVDGLRPTRDGSYAHYGVAKAAVTMYTRYLARDIGPRGFRANAIAPGTVPTGRVRELWGSDRAALDEEIALRRPPEPREIADTACYLLSPASSYVTGQVLTVDGGWTR